MILLRSSLQKTQALNTVLPGLRGVTYINIFLNAQTDINPLTAGLAYSRVFIFY